MRIAFTIGLNPGGFWGKSSEMAVSELISRGVSVKPIVSKTPVSGA